MATGKIPWPHLRNEYVMGFISQTGSIEYLTKPQLAAKYNCSVISITKRADKENWQELREQQQRETVSKIKERVTKFQVASLEDKIKNDLLMIAAAKGKWAADMRDGRIRVTTFDLIQLMTKEAEIYKNIYSEKSEQELNTDDLSDEQKVRYVRAVAQLKAALE